MLVTCPSLAEPLWEDILELSWAGAKGGSSALYSLCLSVPCMLIPSSVTLLTADPCLCSDPSAGFRTPRTQKFCSYFCVLWA